MTIICHFTNVFYSKAYLLTLMVMEYLLSIALNFEMYHAALEILCKRESWLFDESVTEDKMKWLMFFPQYRLNNLCK
jgi:hypothetical protein